MNVAIPIHGSRVMPRFGCTREVMVVTIEGGQIVSRKQVLITPERFLSLPAVLASERVSVVICGGIHPRFQQMIQSQNIQLIWGVIGEWQDVLQAYLNGTLRSNPAFCLRNGSGRGYRLRRGQQRRR
jgi:predicted Fe-Mo cluster-binding NifX family protein